MKALKSFSVLVIVVIAGGFIVLNSLTIRIPAGQVGIRIQQYSLLGSKGVVAKDFGPGWHRDLGPIDNWVVYDATIQTLEMTRDPSRGSRQGRDDVQVQSADGNSISVDVTVKYRIKPGAAYLLYQNVGAARSQYETIVRNESQNACMARFGQMKTEDFYNPQQKRERATEVKEQVAESLTDNSIEVIDVLIRNVEFDPKYESKIRSKKLADQEVELNKSLGEAEKMRGRTQVIEAETKKLVSIIVEEKASRLKKMEAKTGLEVAKIAAEYERYVTEKRADADLIHAQKLAEGELLVKSAEAKGEELRNEAIRGTGGSIIVALEAARNLNLTDATISTLDVDLLDLDGIVEKLGVPVEAE